jgi:hypothetical protein
VPVEVARLAGGLRALRVAGAWTDLQADGGLRADAKHRMAKQNGCLKKYVKQIFRTGF